jgi:hypothetical protein
VRVDKAPGAPTRELSWDDIGRKFLDCANHSGRVTETSAQQAFAAIQRLEESDDIGSIVELLR